MADGLESRPTDTAGGSSEWIKAKAKRCGRRWPNGRTPCRRRANPSGSCRSPGGWDGESRQSSGTSYSSRLSGRGRGGSCGLAAPRALPLGSAEVSCRWCGYCRLGTGPPPQIAVLLPTRVSRGGSGRGQSIGHFYDRSFGALEALVGFTPSILRVTPK